MIGLSVSNSGDCILLSLFGLAWSARFAILNGLQVAWIDRILTSYLLRLQAPALNQCPHSIRAYA